MAWRLAVEAAVNQDWRARRLRRELAALAGRHGRPGLCLRWDGKAWRLEARGPARRLLPLALALARRRLGVRVPALGADKRGPGRPEGVEDPHRPCAIPSGLLYSAVQKGDGKPRDGADGGSGLEEET